MRCGSEHPLPSRVSEMAIGFPTQNGGIHMKLLLRRDQKAGMMGMGSVAFSLDVRAELTDQEYAHIKKYKLGKTMLYERMKIEGGSGVIGIAARLAFKMINLTVSVDDLASGKKIDCKDIVEMLAIEEQVKEACRTFKAVLEAAARFGGEEIIDIT